MLPTHSDARLKGTKGLLRTACLLWDAAHQRGLSLDGRWLSDDAQSRTRRGARSGKGREGLWRFGGQWGLTGRRRRSLRKGR
jgi:hypothetical protein